MRRLGATPSAFVKSAVANLAVARFQRLACPLYLGIFEQNPKLCSPPVIPNQDDFFWLGESCSDSRLTSSTSFEILSSLICWGLEERL